MDIKAEDLLTFLSGYGIINAPVVDKDNMSAKEEYINKHHSSKITLGSDGRWRTRIEQDGKKVMIAKANKSDLINILFDYYGGPKESNITFEEAFEKLKAYKKELVDDNTILKYEYDYNRYFLGTKIESEKIKNITREYLELFIVKRIKKLKLRRRPYQDMFGYLGQVFRHAYNIGILSDNPMNRLERKDYYRYCNEEAISSEKRIATEEEIKSIVSKIHADIKEDGSIVTGFAVELATLTGMRVGEISALRWDAIDFDKGIITIDKAETFHHRDKKYIISKTKTGAIRCVPMTDAIRDLLKRIRETEEENGYICEWVFAGASGQIHKGTIVSYARNKSHQVGLSDAKTIHTFRRTINSRIKENGMSTKAAASMLGHSESVNERHYTYDVTDLEYKRELLSKAQVTV